MKNKIIIIIIIIKNKTEKRNHMSALGHCIFGLVGDDTLFGLFEQKCLFSVDVKFIISITIYTISFEESSLSDQFSNL